MAQLQLVGQDLLIIKASNLHSFRHTTLDRTPLNEESTRRTDLYLTQHNSHKRQISMSPAAFEPTVSAIQRQRTRVLDRAATAFSECAVISGRGFGYHSLTVFKGQYFSTRNSSNEINIDVGPLTLAMA
jgi:hypothetical protein